MKRLFLFIVLFAVFICEAQTNINVVYRFVNGMGQTQTVRQISFTPLTINRLGTAIIVGQEDKRVAIYPAGYTNSMITGVPYRVNYYQNPYPANPATTFTNYFPTSLTNGQTVFAVDYMSFGFFFGTQAPSGGSATNAIAYSFYNTNLPVGVVVTNINSPTSVSVWTGTNALTLRNTNNVVIRQLVTDAYINTTFSTNSSGEITATQTVNTNLVLVNGGSNYVFSGSVSGNFTASNNFTALGVSTLTNDANIVHGTFTGPLNGSATSVTGVLASSNLPPSVITTNLANTTSTLWVAPWGTSGVRGQQYLPYTNLESAYPQMQIGDSVVIQGIINITNNIGFQSGNIKGSQGSVVTFTNLQASGVGYIVVTNNTTYDSLTMIDPVLTNSGTIVDAGTVGASNVLFVNCSITGGRGFYHHAAAAVSWSIDHCYISGKSPITTEVNANNYTLVRNSTINVTNEITGLSQPFARGIFLARNPGVIEVYDTVVYASDAGGTNPVYCFASDMGASANFAARNVSPNALRLHNVHCVVSFTNPLSAVFLITTNNAYLLDNVTMNDGSSTTSYNPSNYATPFNYSVHNDNIPTNTAPIFTAGTLVGNGSGLTNTTVTYNPTVTNYTYTFLGRAGDHVIITNKPNLFLTLAGPFDGDVAFAIEATNNIYIDYGGNSVEWLTPSNNPTASQGHGTLGISKFGSLVKVSFVEGASSTTNFLSAIQTYSTNVTLVSATNLVVQLNPGFSDANYVVTAPNDLVGATVTARTPTNFTLGFTAATLTGQVIEGGVIHR